MPITEEAPMELDEAVDNTVIISMPEIQPTQYPRLAENEFTTADERREGTRVQVETLAARSKPGFKEHVNTWKKSLVRNGVLALSALGLLATACGVGPKNIEVTTTPPIATEPAPKPTEAPTVTATPDIAKPLPSIINKDTVQPNPVTPEEIQLLIDQAQAQGEKKLPIPDVIVQPGISIVEIHNNRGETMLAITADKPGSFNLPSLSDGTVAELLDTGNPSVIGFADKTGKLSYAYVVPEKSAEVMLLLSKDQATTVGQPAIRLNYNPESQIWGSFASVNTRNAKDAPKNTIAIIAAKTGESLTIAKNILVKNGGPVIVSSSGK